MRKIDDSGKTACAAASSAIADAKSRPNGFSTMTRASSAKPALPRPWMTVSNNAGGMAR